MSTATHGSVAGSLIFSTAGSNTLNQQMVLTGAGYLGIGTTNPTTALQVNGTVTTTNAAVTGNLTTTQTTETAVNLGSSLSGTVTLNLASGTYFYGTVTGGTTFAVSNVAASGSVSSFTLELTNGGYSGANMDERHEMAWRLSAFFDRRWN